MTRSILTIKGAIFDLDGTLVDTLADLTDSMNAALVQLGRPRRSRGQCREMIGHGLYRFAQEALGEGYGYLTDELVKQMAAYYKDHCLLKTAPYPGMKRAIKKLAKKQIRLAVLTNKNQAPAEIITHHYFGAGTFNPVVGANERRKVKPDPQTALEIIEQWGLSVKEVVFLGDSEADVQTAIAAGVWCLGCEWGFRSREQLLRAGAQTLIQHPDQIPEILFQ